MAVIDVDSHFEPGDSWLDDYPGLAAKVPPVSAASRLGVMFNDLLADVPLADRPPADQLLPPGFATLIGEEKLEGFEDADMKPVADAATRVGWMDANGIDVENVICLEGLFLARRLQETLRQEAVGACNDWLANASEGGNGRLMPVTAIDMSDVAWSIDQLTRMRARGSRSFLINGTPVDGIPANHSTFDPLWSAATDLGMVPLRPDRGRHVRPAPDQPQSGPPSRAGPAQRPGLRWSVRAPPEPDAAAVRAQRRLVPVHGRAHGLTDRR
jgi:hypothetical protein